MEYHLTLNWPDFLARYWQKRPVVLKRGFANFIDPISPDELAGLAMENEVDSRLVSHLDGDWQVSHGPFESYDHLGESNWSLLVQAVDHWHEPSSALMRPFRVLPDWRIDDLMISFSVPAAALARTSTSMTCLLFRALAVAAGAWARKPRSNNTARIRICFRYSRLTPSLMKRWSPAISSIFHRDSRTKATRWKTHSTILWASARQTAAS